MSDFEFVQSKSIGAETPKTKNTMTKNRDVRKADRQSRAMNLIGKVSVCNMVVERVNTPKNLFSFWAKINI